MKNFKRFATPVFLAILPMMWGCGGTSNPVSASRPEVAISLSPAAVNLVAFQTQQFSATVTNTSNSAVTWNISGCPGGDCGTISSSGLYTAPSLIANSTAFTVIATSLANSSKVATANIKLLPIWVSLSPSATTSVVGAGSRDFVAAVQNDLKDAGVTWTLSGKGCSGDSCGALTEVSTTSAVYHPPGTLPSPPTVTLTATSKTDGRKSAAAAIQIASSVSYSALKGSYAFLIRGFRYNSWFGAPNHVTIAGHLEADGNGSFSGVWDVNLPKSVTLAEPITGSYETDSAGQGTLTIHDGSASWTYNLTVNALGTAARFAEDSFFPASGASAASPYYSGSSGFMAKQDSSQFYLSSIAGDRVIALAGGNVAALGRFTSNAAGNLTLGVADLSWEGGWLHFFNTTSLTGTFSAPDPVSGRGEALLFAGGEAFNFAFYVVSDRNMLLIQTDEREMDILSGEVRFQNGVGGFSNNSLDAPVVFGTTSYTFDFDFPEGSRINVGRMAPNGSGVLSTTWDQNDTSRISLNTTTVGTYAVVPNGRVTLDFPGNAVGYLVDRNTGYLVRGYSWGAAFGSFEPQTGEPFNVATLKGDFMVNTVGPSTTSAAANVNGMLTFGENGAVKATLHVNTGSGASAYSFSGNFTAAPNGRGEMVLNTTADSPPQHITFWVTSPSSCLAIMTMEATDTRPVLLSLERLETN